MQDRTEAVMRWLIEPYLYSFAKRIAEARETKSFDNVIPIAQGYHKNAKRELAKRYENAKYSILNIERVARRLTDLQKKTLEGRMYQRHDLRHVWLQGRIDELEKAVVDTELDKLPEYTLELGAVRRSYLINTGGHLRAFGKDVSKGVLKTGAGASMAVAGAGFAIGGTYAPYPANIVAGAGGGLAMIIGGGLSLANLADIRSLRVDDPFAKVAGTLEERAIYIRKALLIFAS